VSRDETDLTCVGTPGRFRVADGSLAVTVHVELAGGVCEVSVRDAAGDERALIRMTTGDWPAAARRPPDLCSAESVLALHATIKLKSRHKRWRHYLVPYGYELAEGDEPEEAAEAVGRLCPLVRQEHIDAIAAAFAEAKKNADAEAARRRAELDRELSSLPPGRDGWRG
jgi:hypothetical protein